MKLLHSADWHLGSPLGGFEPVQREMLRQALRSVPGQIARLCRREGCDLMLLAGDLFDGPPDADSVAAVREALEEAAVPVLIAPGNHDWYDARSVWATESWPGNVHIFSRAAVESVSLPEQDCRVYGTAFEGMDCPGLLEGIRAAGPERFRIGVLHGDPTQSASPYCPITSAQIAASGFDYLALGHIHKSGTVTAGKTLCAWPGCPMGRGFDETGAKGVLLVTLEQTAGLRFVPLEVPVFHDLETEAGEDPAAAVAALLPGAESRDFYRITLTGPAEKPDLAALGRRFAGYPNLTLRDRTVPVQDLWRGAEEDSLEGVYFRKLRDLARGEDPETREIALLAARMSRDLLDGREVTLP